jgi:hypothetical protein
MRPPWHLGSNVYILLDERSAALVVCTCTTPDHERFTRVLDSIKLGRAQTTEELLPMVFEELRKLAAPKINANEPDAGRRGLE